MKLGIITGASSGLGAEYALRAVSYGGGLDELWLIARRTDRLQALAARIPNCRVRCIPLDLADLASFAAFDALLAEAQPDLRLLIANAGLGILGDFDALDTRDNIAMCDVNIRALTVLTARAVPYMSRGSGIIFTSSIASFAPVPRMSVYAATKAYVSHLAKGIRAELAPRGIHVLAVNPCPMDTEFLEVGKIAGNSPAFARLPRCKPDRVAATALRYSERGRGQYTPLVLFKLYRVLARVLPHGLVMKFTRV